MISLILSITEKFSSWMTASPSQYIIIMDVYTKSSVWTIRVLLLASQDENQELNPPTSSLLALTVYSLWTYLIYFVLQMAF